jgi:transcriptional regulator with XRE-family HTH domain
MGGVAFGQTIKHLRKKAKIASKNLSTQVGKASTYVSQLERGLIKNPDYNTCHKLLELVGVDPGCIEQMLVNHGFVKELNTSFEDTEETITSEPLTNDLPANAENNSRIYDRKYKDTKDKNEKLFKVFGVLVDTDITRASVVINNVYKLTQDENNLDFLCAILSLNYAQLPPESRDEILARLRKWF